MEKFIQLYIKEAFLEIEIPKNKVKIEKADNEINSLLKYYPILLEDVWVLYKSFNKVKKDEYFSGEFRPFLAWLFDKLYSQKIANKKTHNFLIDWLSKYNLEPRKSSLTDVGWMGV